MSLKRQRGKQDRPSPGIPDIEAYYRRLVKKYPNDPRSDGYSHAIAQEVRYEAYLSHLDLNRKTILDVGCGTGQMLRYLTRRAIWPSRYVGIDILPEKIEIARTLYERDGFFKFCRAYGVDASFVAGDIADIREKFDNVVACSIFDVKQTDVPTTFRLACETMQRMWDRAKDGIGIDFFSPYALDIQPFNAPIPPEWVLTWAKVNLSERVLLDYTYAPHDYMVVVKRGASPFKAMWLAEGGWKRETGGEEDASKTSGGSSASRHQGNRRNRDDAGN